MGGGPCLFKNQREGIHGGEKSRRFLKQRQAIPPRRERYHIWKQREKRREQTECSVVRREKGTGKQTLILMTGNPAITLRWVGERCWVSGKGQRREFAAVAAVEDPHAVLSQKGEDQPLSIQLVTTDRT